MSNQAPADSGRTRPLERYVQILDPSTTHVAWAQEHALLDAEALVQTQWVHGAHEHNWCRALDVQCSERG